MKDKRCQREFLLLEAAFILIVIIYYSVNGDTLPMKISLSSTAAFVPHHINVNPLFDT